MRFRSIMDGNKSELGERRLGLGKEKKKKNGRRMKMKDAEGQQSKQHGDRNNRKRDLGNLTSWKGHNVAT